MALARRFYGKGRLDILTEQQSKLPHSHTQDFDGWPRPALPELFWLDRKFLRMQRRALPPRSDQSSSLPRNARGKSFERQTGDLDAVNMGARGVKTGFILFLAAWLSPAWRGDREAA